VVSSTVVNEANETVGRIDDLIVTPDLVRTALGGTGRQQ
jgi:hypothetical protein